MCKSVCAPLHPCVQCAQSGPWIKSAGVSAPRAAHAAAGAMLGWNEEVQWRGEGPRAPGLPFRPAAYGAGDSSWKNFILQTQGIAGNARSTNTKHKQTRGRDFKPLSARISRAERVKPGAREGPTLGKSASLTFRSRCSGGSAALRA